MDVVEKKKKYQIRYFFYMIVFEIKLTEKFARIFLMTCYFLYHDTCDEIQREREREELHFY